MIFLLRSLMPSALEHIIDPETIQNVKDFEWLSKLLSRGYTHGKHFSNRLGSGNEFQQFRPYVPGDDIRGIDWKMYAKTEKYYIRQTDVESERKYLFIIDNSPSMKYRENGWTKLLLTKLLVAAMSRIVSNQGDGFGIMAGGLELPIKSGLRHWQYMIEELYRLDFSTLEFPMEASLGKNVSVAYYSDFYHPSQEIERRLKNYKTPQTDVINFHLLGGAEKTLNFTRNSTFVDLESSEKIDVDAPATRQEYERKLSAHINTVRRLSYRLGADYYEVNMNGKLSEVLRHFFHRMQFSPT